MSRVAKQRGPVSFEAFLEKLASDVDPDVARIAYLHSQDWVGIPNFPVMPEDTFEFYGCVDDDKEEELQRLATDAQTTRGAEAPQFWRPFRRSGQRS